MTGILVLAGSVCLYGSVQEIVDRIAAVVNDEVITESDIRIIAAFRLDIREDVSLPPLTRAEILSRCIDRKLVLQLFGADETPGEEELAVLMTALKGRIDPAEFRDQLDAFGMREEDLEPYLAEAQVYKRIIDRRFNQAVRVTLQEIETHYRSVYVPGITERGQTPPPLTEALEEIELQIKRDKVSERVKDWLSNLRRQADIRIMDDKGREKRPGSG